MELTRHFEDPEQVRRVADGVWSRLVEVATEYADGDRPMLDLLPHCGRFVGDSPGHLDEDEDWEDYPEYEDEDDEDDDDFDPCPTVFC